MNDKSLVENFKRIGHKKEDELKNLIHERDRKIQK